MRNALFAVTALLTSAFVFAGCAPGTGTAETARTDVAAAANAASFDAGISAIFAERCASCHIDESKGQLSLANLESALAGGKSGAVILPNDAEHSLLYQMVSGAEGVKKMPPRGEALTPEQIGQLKAWIDAGAK